MSKLSKRQIELLKGLAIKYNLSQDKVKELLGKIGQWSSHSISTIKRAEDNLYDPTSAKTIHLTMFGKLVPNTSRMNKIKEILSENKKSKDAK
jgi:hypothetical protein